MRNTKSSLLAVAALSMLASAPALETLPTDAPPKPRRKAQNVGKLSLRRRKSTLHPMNGKRECARRLRQIAAGTLVITG